MSPTQKQIRSELERVHGRPPRDAYARAMSETLDLLLAKVPSDKVLQLVTDDHRQYALAIARHPERSRIERAVHPNPKRGAKGSARSREAIRRDRAMATLDHAHQFIRHSSSHHGRETLAFCRRHTALIGRLFLHVVWVNLIKLRVENDPESGTRAMAAGLTRERWDWPRLLAQRLQPHQVDLPSEWRALYFRQQRYPERYETKPHSAVRAI